MPGPAPAWFPTTEGMERTNVVKLLRQLNLKSYPELYRWSIEHRNAYWQMMIEHLGIQFHTPYERLCDSQPSTEQARWLIGAKLNIAESCFHAPPESVAIRFRNLSGMISDWTYLTVGEY